MVEIDWSYRNEYEVRLKRERLIDATQDAIRITLLATQVLDFNGAPKFKC
jgi:hypothetical protein